jgi:hypothetical protein
MLFQLTTMFNINCNTLPKIPEVKNAEAADAYLRRLMIILYPCTYKAVTDHDFDPAIHKVKDTDLKRKIAQNLTGVLTWIVEGAMEYYNCDVEKYPNGAFPPVPRDFAKCMDKYTQDRDWTRLFEKTEDKDDFISRAEMIAVIHDSMSLVVTPAVVKARMESMGCVEVRKSGARGYRFLREKGEPREVCGDSSDEEDALDRF